MSNIIKNMFFTFIIGFSSDLKCQDLDLELYMKPRVTPNKIPNIDNKLNGKIVSFCNIKSNPSTDERTYILKRSIDTPPIMPKGRAADLSFFAGKT